MKLLLSLFVITIFSACAGTSSPPTPYPTSTPYPTPTSVPADEALAQAIYDRIDRDDTIPAVGKEVVISLFSRKPTFAFQDNQGLALQFSIPHYPPPAEAKKAAVLLMGTAVNMAAEQGVPLDGVEVVYFHKGEPWAALAAQPPWREQQSF
jgi:hypothetical protein